MEAGAIPNAILQIMIQDLLTKLGTDGEIGLFTGPLEPDPDTTMAQVLAAAPVGSWYTAKAAVPGTLFRSDDGRYGFGVNCLSWAYSGTDPMETITGWFLHTKTGATGGLGAGTLVAARRLDTPAPMGDALNQVRVDPILLWPPVPAT